MKIVSAQALAALKSSDVVFSASGEFFFGSQTWRLWAGMGEREIEGHVYTGAGARALIVPIVEDLTGAASGVRLTLSGLEPEIAMTIEQEDYHQRPVVLRRLIFASDRLTLLAAPVFFRGRVDVVRFEEQIGEPSALEFYVESGARDLERRGLRVRSNSDQRILGGATDSSLKYVAIAGERSLYWGGQAPQRAGTALGGGYPIGNFGLGGGQLSFTIDPVL